MIPSFSHITIRVTYRPAEVGNFSYVVRIENVKDPNSVHFINIHSSVVSELRPVRLRVLCFGAYQSGQRWRLLGQLTLLPALHRSQIRNRSC